MSSRNVVHPFLECEHNGYELFLVDVIVYFYVRELKALGVKMVVRERGYDMKTSRSKYMASIFHVYDMH